MDYLLLVIQKDEKVSLDKLLAPYYKHKEVAPYLATTKAELLAQIKEDIEDKKNNGPYADYLKAKELAETMPTKENKKNLKQMQKEYKKLIAEMDEKVTWDDERCFQEALKTFHYPGEWQENGDFMSTHNPDSHWDYHRTGGMFENIIPLKNGLRATTARMGDIDFGPQPEQYMEAALEWENNKALQTVSRESYCTFNSSLIPFAVLVDNIWFDRNDPTFFQKYNVLTHDHSYDDHIVTALECHI
jgi:hypothetical protein